MTDEPTAEEEQEPTACSELGPLYPPVNDITHQSHRLGRFIDRLPPGRYSFELCKGERWEAWQLEVRRDGETVRLMDLFR